MKHLAPRLSVLFIAIFLLCPVLALGRTIPSGFNTTQLPPNDDGSAGPITLPFSVNFFGTTYTQVYVNNNGNLTFGTSSSDYTPGPLANAGLPIIAPFFADVDTQGAGSGLAAYGNGTFAGRQAFGATWTNVGYYSSRTDKLNTFQVILVERNDVATGAFDIYFNYGQIQWETGEASGGVNGLGGTSARAGFANGTVSYEIPGAGTPGAYLDSGTSPLVSGTNNGVPGQFYFPVRNGQVAPVISSLSPSGVIAGAGATNVTVFGSGFIVGSVVNVNGQARTTPTTSQQGTVSSIVVQLTAQETASVSTRNITVSNTGGASNSVPFSVVTSLTDTPQTAPTVVDTRTAQTANTNNSPSTSMVPNCGSQSTARGAWLRYTAPVDGTATFDLAGTSYVSLLSLWRAPVAGQYVQVGCDAGQTRIARNGTREFIAPKTSFGVTAGQTIFVLVTAPNGDGGGLRLATGFVASSPVPQVGYNTMMPHVVTGGGYVTKLTIVNMSGATNNVSVNFVNDAGVVSTSVTRTLAIGETMRVATDEAQRNGPIASQWASINAQGRIAANLFFEISDQSPQNNIINTVGFNDDPGQSTLTIPVEFEPGTQAIPVGRTVGLALTNPNNATATVTLKLRQGQSGNNGVQLGSDDVIVIPPYGHTARALNSDFSAVLPNSNFVGTITGTVTGVPGVTAVALGDDLGPFFATPSMAGGTRLIVPHMVTGGLGGAGYVTKLLVVNQAATTNIINITYYDQAGNVANTFGLPTSFSLPAFGSIRIATPEQGRFGTLVIQTAQITGSANLGVNLFFEIMDGPITRRVINTVGFNNSPETADFTVPVEVEPGSLAVPVGRTVGMALVNANGGVATVDLTVKRQDGTTLAVHHKAVNPNSQLLFDLKTEFSEIPSQNFVGALVVHSSVPVSAIVLEDDLGPFSAIPVFNGQP